MLALLKYWREGLIGLVLIFAALQWVNGRHWQKRYASEHEARLQLAADFKAFANGVTAKSQAIVAKANVRNARIAAEFQTIEKENDSEIRRRIAAAVATVRLRASQGGADPRGSRDAMPGTPDAAGSPDRAGAHALVPASDLEICAEAVIKAEGWQAWWARVTAVER